MAMLKTWQELTGYAGPKSNASIVEDLRDFIENVSAVDRPALSLLRKTRVRTHYVEWLEDTLASRAHNAAAEGAAATQPDLTTPTRSTAVVQTFAKWGQVSDIQRAVEHAGTEDMYLYQENKNVRECLNDMEHAIHRGSMVTGASGTEARQMKGFLNVFSTNLTDSSGTTFTEEVYGDLLQLYVDGGTEIRPSVTFVNSYLKRTISQFSTSVTRNIEAEARRQLLVVDRYTSDFGDVDIYYSRDQLKGASKTAQGNSAVILDPTFFELGFLQSLQSETLARDGLRTQFQISAMMTLIYRSEKAGGGCTSYVPYIPAS
jgi:hypothetical protein